MNWRNWAMKLGYLLGYKKGYDASFQTGVEQGKKEGERTAMIMAELLREYGGFDQIPTHLLHQLPMGEEFAQRQTLKRAFFSIRALSREVNMGVMEVLAEDLADFLEMDTKQNEVIMARFNNMLHESSMAGALLSYAGDRGEIDVKEFLARLHREPPLLKRYYKALKNESHIVK